MRYNPDYKIGDCVVRRRGTLGNMDGTAAPGKVELIEERHGHVMATVNFGGRLDEHVITASDLRKIPKEPCRLCRERGKTWRGDDPTCSFPDGGEFDPEGWNCATANRLRDISGQDEPHPSSDYRYCEDQNYTTIKIDGIDLPSGNAYALWMTWYKHRGRTEGMWILSVDEPRKPTEADALAIIGALSTSNP